jgi:hypothetical protein
MLDRKLSIHGLPALLFAGGPVARVETARRFGMNYSPKFIANKVSYSTGIFGL